MRKWHRWLSFIFGAFLLFIAITGVASHLVPIIARGGLEGEKGGPPPVMVPGQPGAQSAPGAGMPPGMPGGPTASGGAPGQTRQLVGMLHRLHSGEQFGTIGVIVSILSGMAMIFFSISGLWLYFDMLTRRSKAEKKGLFWH